MSRTHQMRWKTGGLALAAAGVAVLALAALYQIWFYLRLPADLLSFAESPFLDDVIKLRLGEPLYQPPGDNNSFPYSVGTQLLTYGLAKLFGGGESIAAMRTVQFGYVLAACGVGVAICHQLAKRLAGPGYRHRPLWWTLWGSTLVLVAIDPRFNAYTHSLHNDGLGLLVSALAFWAMVRYEAYPRRWLLVASCLLPVAGFMVKQSLLIWLGLAAAWYVVSGRMRIRGAVLFVAAGVLAAAALVALQYALWGPDYWWWVFGALGGKSVSPLRAGLHLLQAGGYLLLGLASACVLLLPTAPRGLRWLWAAWLLLFLGEAWTSGLGWVMNHLGPGVLLAACWFLVASARLWDDWTEHHDPWTRAFRTAVLVVSLVLVPGALGLVRVPQNRVPADFDRYLSEIEAQFEGLPSEDVLIDNGSWIYFREGVLMRDRSSPASVHFGPNQAEPNREYLAGTIDRIRSGAYAKILTRELYTGRSPYAFQNRDTGIREAILEAYRETDRIAGVEGVDEWWPRNLLSEIIVLEPRGATGGSEPVAAEGR